MKFLTAIALSFAALTASAQTTINLQPEPCAAYWCAGVPNDAGATLLIYWSGQYETIGVNLNGDAYFVKLPAGSFNGSTANVTGIVLTDPAGKQVVLTMQTREWSVLGGSGRGQGWHPQTALIGGTLQVYP